MIETLLNKPYWVIDFLPEQVPDGSAGQFFAVEEYYLRKPALSTLRRRFTDILLKLNCYYDFQVCAADSEEFVRNPAPDILASRVLDTQENLCILLPREDALITLDRDDTCMTVYNPSETLLNRLRLLATAEGLFLWQP